MTINHPLFGAEVRPESRMTKTKKESETKPTVLFTPLVETAGFMSISLLFWLRDFVDRNALRLKKLISRLLSLFYLFGSFVDPLLKKRWGTEARLQILFWSGSCFPWEHHNEQCQAPSPTPDSELWAKAFELSFNKTPEHCAVYNTSETLNTLGSELDNGSRKPCFEEAHNLPSFDNALASIKIVKSGPSTPVLSTKATLTRLATKCRNEESRKRTQQRKIFAKWSNMRLKRSKTELKKKEKNITIAKENLHALDQSKLNTNHPTETMLVSLEPSKDVLGPCALESPEIEIDLGHNPSKIAGLADMEAKHAAPLLPDADIALRVSRKVTPSKRQRFKNVFKHNEE